MPQLMRCASSKLRSVVLAVAVVLPLAGTSRADVVRLKSGGRLEGVVEEDGDIVHVSCKGMRLTLSRRQIESIERVELPEDLVRRRLSSLRQPDVEGALDVAARASQLGLADEAGTALRLALEWAPDDPRVTSELRRWTALVRLLPDDPAADDELRASFGAGATVVNTAHFRIAHDLPMDEARRRADALEAAYKKVFEFCDAVGIEPRPVAEKMSVMIFADHDRWADSVRTRSGSLNGVTGIYIVSTRCVHLFDTDTLPDVVLTRRLLDECRARAAEADRALEPKRRVVQDLWTALRRANFAREWDRAHQIKARIGEEEGRLAEAERAIRELRSTVAERERVVAETVAGENLAASTHEACHQVFAATGLCGAEQPLWLLEGLASMFEIKSRASFVLDARNESRLEELRAAWSQGRTTPLTDVVSDEIFRRGDPGLAYAASWSLVHYLFRRHPEGLAAYIRATRDSESRERSPESRVTRFRTVLGADLDALEASWRADAAGDPPR